MYEVQLELTSLIRPASFLHRYLLVLLAVALVFTAGPGRAQTIDSTSQAAAVNALVDILGAITSLEAEVEQLTLDQEGREVQVINARMAMQKPDHFRWQVTAPYEELLVTNGSVIWRHEPDLDQVTIQEFSQDYSRTPVLLLNGSREDLMENFSITHNTLPGSNEHHFVLLPIDPGSLFERLSVSFMNGSIQQMQFQDSLGQQTSLSFTQLEMNQALSPELFSFEIPDGLEVIDNRAM